MVNPCLAQVIEENPISGNLPRDVDALFHRYGLLAWMGRPEARLLVPHPDLRAAWKYYGLHPPS